ncbi:MAG TPA: type II toxin-antitoxin system HicB family antitoxin [Dehalococcoidia bacterium]|nr:type II toxin-antitoxin system HicB family antitoxin [Dehalococcoidia bacterium]
MDYIIVIHPAEEGGYWAEVPALPGCFAQGESLEDLLGDARGAIASHIEALREDGQPVPPGGVIVASVNLPETAAAAS